jgi:hypothetical protein
MFYKCKPEFEPLDDFSSESDEYQSCLIHQDLQLLYGSSSHLTKLNLSKFKIFKNGTFEPKFEIQSDFNLKCDEYQSCSTNEDL